MRIASLLVVFTALACSPVPASAQAVPPGRSSGEPVLAAAPRGVDALVARLTRGSFSLVDANGRTLGSRRRVDSVAVSVSEPEIVETLQGVQMSGEQAAALWSFFGDDDNNSMLTLPIVRALVGASNTPKAREEMWSQLAAWSRAMREGRSRNRERSLLGVFERNRPQLLALLVDLRETEGASDEMIELMTSSRVFGAEIDESVNYVSSRIPGFLARRIERERELGRPVKWEYAAFENMMRWKDARLLTNAPKAPRTLAELDAAGETYVTIFNCLHTLDSWYRIQMLRGLGPIELFNVVVGGELELYRLGTSGYRNFLHDIIMRGVKEAGSFEAFLKRAVPRNMGEEAARASARRGMVFLRVASSFGLLDKVLETVADRARFIDEAIASLGDPASFEANSSVVMDMMTSRAGSAATMEFRRALRERLYERYAGETVTAQRHVYGSMLSVYQTMTEDRRDAAIDSAYPLDASLFLIPYDRLFGPDGNGGYVHRMFMRMDEDIDASSTYGSFRKLMAALGATVRDERSYDVWRISGLGRSIEIYANKPTSAGVRQGIGDIARALSDKRIHTVIGRGHTGIISPLQADAKRVLGERRNGVTVVLVGACGGDASVRELIGTFGYVPFFTTKSTGRQVINDAIIQAYVDALLTLVPGERLAIQQVLDRGVARFLRGGSGSELRADASLYQVNMPAVLTAYLFERHVRPEARHSQVVTRE